MKNKYDLSRKQFKPRIIAVLLTGTVKLGQELIKSDDELFLKTIIPSRKATKKHK